MEMEATLSTSTPIAPEVVVSTIQDTEVMKKKSSSWKQK